MGESKYVLWASVGEWPVDRDERPIGVFDTEEQAREAMSTQPNSYGRENAYYVIFKTPLGRVGEGVDVDDD